MPDKLIAQSLEIAHLPAANQLPYEALDRQPRHSVGIAAWPEFNYRPQVSFSIVHDNTHIYIKYYVQEQSIRAFYRQSNEPVYEDSCVEFFIAWDDKGYYNFEFNCLGTCLMAFGPGRESRQSMDASIIASIQRFSRITSPFSGNPGEEVSWELEVKIPLDVFAEHRISTIAGRQARANFYKCGDGLPKPHYLSWKEIQTPAPDFHRPEFFGSILFA